MNLDKYPAADELAISAKTESILDRIFAEIKEANLNDERKINFYYNGEHFPCEKTIYEILEIKKYSICWNSPCLWYEISW